MRELTRTVPARPPAMAAAVQAVWQRGLPLTHERIALLVSTATQLSETHTLNADLQKEAVVTAHKLAGSLGMFGFAAATEHARAIEAELSHTALPQPERLQAHVDALSAIIPVAVPRGGHFGSAA